MIGRTAPAMMLLALASLGCRQLASETPRSERDEILPNLVIWAWDRAEDLRFVDPSTAAIAVFESIVRVGHADVGQTGVAQTGVNVRPRHHPMKAAAGMALLGVVRIEVQEGIALGDAERESVLDAVLAYHRPEHTVGLQVDFDARRSERDFYRALLGSLRARLPADQGLSITALASWCLGDPWLDGLPIDDAVPMLFRMGRDSSQIRATLDAGVDFSSPICRRSVGLSTDEPWPATPNGRRTYLFHPQAWTPESFRAALRLRDAR